jgi:hypothetical protein
VKDCEFRGKGFKRDYCEVEVAYDAKWFECFTDESCDICGDQNGNGCYMRVIVVDLTRRVTKNPCDPPPGSISCPECGQVVKSKGGLTNHVNKKHGKKSGVEKIRGILD